MIHCFCGFFLCYTGVFYLYLVDSSVLTDLSLYSVSSNPVYFPLIAKMYFVLSSFHGLLVVFIVVRSIEARRLVFRKLDTQASPSISRIASRRLSRDTRRSSQEPIPPQLADHAARLTLTQQILIVVRCIWRLLRAVFAAFDVRSENYGLVFLVRELILTSLQTYQTYRLSCLVPRRWMNNLMVGLLVLNCWATPLLQYFLRSEVGRIRLSGALVNMALDMVSYIGLPAALLLPYANQINREVKQFDRIYWYSDAWLIGLINEAQMVFVTSLYDAISKSLIALSVARGLFTITKLIRTADMIRLTGSRGRDSSNVTRVAPFEDRSTTALPASDSSGSWSSRLERAAHCMLVVWGFCVLIAHLQASLMPSYPQCRLPIRPWFSNQPSCALLEINCVEEQASGRATELDQILRVFDPARIEYLVVRHCPLLEVPARITSLNVLLGLKVFNATILDWSADAALTNSRHPELRFLFLVDVKMRELPIGLQSPNFPKALRDIEVSRTNLSVIPDTLDKVWPKGFVVSFEECQLQEIPASVLRMQPQDLGFSLNNITVVPAELFDSPIRMLRLDGNPIKALPNALRKPPQVAWIDLIGTQISTLPDWMDAAFLATTWVIAARTPLCDRLIAAGEASEAESRALMGIFGIDCSFAFFGDGALLWYPIDIEESINPSYSLS